MTQLYPQVIDRSSIQGIFNLPQFLSIGIEGWAAADGDADVATPYLVSSGQEADALFGSGSSLSDLVKFVLGRGVNFVYAVASIMDDDDAPNLVQRKAAWTTLEENPEVRIRLTDSVVQADLVALATSCEWAEGIQNKQFCFVGLTTPTTQNNLTTAAAAMNSKRGLLVGPGVYDDTGTLRNGAYASAYVAAEVAKNPDITDDLDTVPIAGTAGIERAANGMPLFRLKAGAGTPVNDFETLLQAGVSPLRQGKNGQAEIVHLRPTYTTDDTFDALMTLLIKDAVFLGIRDELEGEKFLRRGNTPDNRSLAAQIVNQYLTDHATWVMAVDLPGGVGYGVTVESTDGGRGMKVSWQGEIVRNNQTIDLAGTYVIPV